MHLHPPFDQPISVHTVFYFILYVCFSSLTAPHHEWVVNSVTLVCMYVCVSGMVVECMSVMWNGRSGAGGWGVQTPFWSGGRGISSISNCNGPVLHSVDPEWFKPICGESCNSVEGTMKCVLTWDDVIKKILFLNYVTLDFFYFLFSDEPLMSRFLFFFCFSCLEP